MSQPRIRAAAPPAASMALHGDAEMLTARCRPARRIRWVRAAAIAIAAVVLASCRSLAPPTLLPLAAQLGGSHHASDAAADGGTASGVAPETGSRAEAPRPSGSDLWPAASRLAERDGSVTPTAPARIDHGASRPLSTVDPAVDPAIDPAVGSAFGRESRAFLSRTDIDAPAPADEPPPADALVPADAVHDPDAAHNSPHVDAPPDLVVPTVGRMPAGCVTGAGCDPPCPPLRRFSNLRCRTTGACGVCGGQPSAGCGDEVCLPLARGLPAVGPYLVCDGGDCLAPARPVGRDGIVNLTAGDTVARYRADDRPLRQRQLRASAAADAESDDDVAVDDVADDDAARRDAPSRRAGRPHDAETSEACLAVSNCACVYSPRFASVREVIQPREEAAPVGPGGLAVDTVAAADIRRQPVWGSTQRVALEAARRAEPGVAVEERLPPLAVDQTEMPHAEENGELPAERVGQEQPEGMLRTQRPLLRVGFDVPIAWTCVKAANVLLNDEAAHVVAADRGTATLRFEEPGRCELTLCKRAGSDTARVGEELDFTIYLLNSGDRPLTDVVLVDALPRRLELLPQTAASSLPADFSTETGDDGSVVLKWRFTGTLEPNEAGFVRFRTLVR